MLIMIEGTECYPDFAKGADWTTPAVDYAHYGEPSKVFGAWWGGNLRGVKDCPVDPERFRSHIVYSPHDYGPLVYDQKWFYMDDDSKTFSRQTLLDDYWYDSWAYLVEENQYPLLMGEWGGFIDSENDPTGENKHWMQELRDYMIDKHIHHTFWCYNWNSGDTGGLTYEEVENWDEEKYEFIKPSLWQTEDGRFISLDHQIPVGSNGISLSQYYGSEPLPPKPTEGTTEAVTEQVTEAVTEPVTDAPTQPVTDDEPTAAPTSDSEPVYGDVDESGKVNVLDVIALYKHLLTDAPLTEQGKRNADVDGSGRPDATDALNILKAVVNLIKLPLKK